MGAKQSTPNQSNNQTPFLGTKRLVSISSLPNAVVFLSGFCSRDLFFLPDNQTPLLGTNVLTFTHRWTIENCVHLFDENCQWKWKIESEKFLASENEKLKFSLSIWPKVKNENGEEYLKVGLYSHQVPAIWKGKVTMKEIRCIEDEEGKKLFTKVYPDEKVYANNWINYGDFVSVAELLGPSMGYLRKGTLTVLTQVTLFSTENSFNWPSSSPYTFSTTTIPSSVSRLSHRLIIAHFKWLTQESTGEMPLKVDSPYFAPEREDIGRMRLEFYPKGVKGSDEEKVLIAIQNNNQRSLLVHYECSLIDNKGNKCHQNENTDQFASINGKSRTLTRRALLSLLSSLPKDELIIDCKVTVLVCKV